MLVSVVVSLRGAFMVSVICDFCVDFLMRNLHLENRFPGFTYCPGIAYFSK